MRTWRAVVLLVLAATLSGCSRGGEAGSSGRDFVSGPGIVTRIAPEDRRSMPHVTGRLLGGGSFDSSDYANTVLVFNVWGSWCVPCREEAPALQAVWDDTKGQGVQFVGINVKDNDAAAIAFEKEFGITYPSIRTADSPKVLLAFRSTLPPGAVPSTVIVDPDGRVAVRVVGATTYRTLSRLVQGVLGGHEK